MTRFYLDHAATSPLRPEARAGLEEGWRIWANPSSPHAEGRAARAALEEARARLKAALGWHGEVIFTSGASEAAALALGRARLPRRLVSAVEHDCVLRAAPGATLLPVRGDGRLELEPLAQALDQGEPALVAVQALNSETGNRQLLYPVSQMVRQAGGWLLVDAAQALGQMEFAPEADLAILSAHKFGGPVGVGALLLRDWAMLEAAGGQERGYRRGTENLPGVLGMVAALEAALASASPPGCGAALERLRGVVTAAGGVWLGDQLSGPSRHIHAIAMPGRSATAQVMRFDLMGFAVSQGSACSSGTMKTSAVLSAMALAPELASRVIRVSLGWNSTAAEVDAFADAWVEVAGG